PRGDRPGLRPLLQPARDGGGRNRFVVVVANAASGIGKAVESILPRGNVMKHPALYMLAMALLASVPAAMAQPYPAKPIKIVIPFPSVNSMYIMTRLAVPKMTERMAQLIFVE